MIELYTEENLSIGETALRLQTNYKTVPDELARHSIEKHSSGYFYRRQPELYRLKVGENAVIERPRVKNPPPSF